MRPSATSCWSRTSAPLVSRAGDARHRTRCRPADGSLGGRGRR
ncbi:hypothetical protein ACFFX0_05465 [Citricoccus parietis]|uniref:Uncharacterized protein n=1 Tax=Citricoccus parietis TaxID=592307 RepID=A0ABV5FW39_9MICC